MTVQAGGCDFQMGVNSGFPGRLHYITCWLQRQRYKVMREGCFPGTVANGFVGRDCLGCW